ncbi:hypothetical protein BG844_09545 [Couchioplanes caeruleus subsp. caeruleus]|uniref:Uncharacterized protein n=2 Tax=Couchioplanes caeruleus TaxID=56438 RepID=A0A1K0GB51_9ACTN|nr:hypothetical protein BG844_09545 [Couchioplanes caeruleus subsp. caeruleus]
MSADTRARLLRAAHGQRLIPAAPVPMGIRYRTPARPVRPAPVDRRPLWMTLADPELLTEIAQAPARPAAPRRRSARPAPAQPAARVLGSYGAYACEACGSRYGQDDPEHGCGPLTPVTVTITVRNPGGPR